MFNPENDIALADGKAGFTPPKNAAALHRCGAMLLWWLGGPADAVLVDERDIRLSGAYAADMAARFGDGPRIVGSLGEGVERCYTPWGWSRNTLRQFERAGASFPPAEAERMDRLRQLSHRRVSIDINRSLSEAGIGEFPPLPREATDTSAIMSAIDDWGTVYVKAPWSSTGRGVVCSADMSLAELMRRSEGTIKRQGSVMVEKAMDKEADFAMLFCSEDGAVRFIGYSLFFNGHGSAYGGNLLLDDDEIECVLSEFVPTGVLRRIADTLEETLGRMVAADYQGVFGVDMMICRDGTGGFIVAPCVELNLRLTMGYVAHRLARRFRGYGYGRLVVGPASAAGGDSLWLVPRNDSYFIGLV